MISHSYLDDVIHLHTVDSTNLELKRRRDELTGKNILILSDEQTAGQGQKGRKWDSAPDLGLWMSLFLGNQNFLAQNFRLLSIFTGIIVHKTISPLLAKEVQLKWPNDIMINEKKCGGILTEVQWQGENITSAIIGIGLNLTHGEHDFPTSIRNMATSLELEGAQDLDKAAIAQSFVDTFFSESPLLENGDKLANIWNSAAYKLNQPIKWEGLSDSFEGQFSGIDKRGDALIRIGGAVRSFHSGEIRLKETL